ncbi:CPBP family intramembrane metalloprotease [Massilia sp. UMI-21]|nr:CPBP family intramembrane metalloprotease [Massilia sp. UMI-21]
MAIRITTLPPRWAHWRCSLQRRPFVTAAALGACLGILSSCCALLLLGVSLQLLPPEQWGDSAASSLRNLGRGTIFVLAVIYAPLIESFVGQLIPMEILRRFRAHPAVCVLLGGVVFGAGHSLTSGLVHGIASFAAGCVFACAYVAMRWAGISASFLAVSSAHAMHKLMLLFVFAPLVPPAF